MTSYYYLQLLQAACEEGLAEALGTQRVYFFAVAINAIPVEQRVESVRIAPTGAPLAEVGRE